MNHIAVIGQTNFRNIKTAFGIYERDRLAHMLIIGKTGSGKSTALMHMMKSDLENGAGFALLDGHGDLADQVLQLVPQQRIPDVVYVNPTKPGFAPAINLLSGRGEYLAVAQFLSTFQHIWPEFWGPRTEYLLRNSLLLLQQTLTGACLADVPRVLTNFSFREALADSLPTGSLREYWQTEFEAYSKHFRSEAISPILNKLGAIVFNPVLRPLLCQRRNDIDFRELMDSGKILIVNLAKGSVGEDGAALLGSILLGKLILAGLSRADVPEEQRRFFGVYCDEAQQFMTESTVNLFSELRKYKVGGVWSTQYLTGLPEKIREGILGNVGSLLSFSASALDAERLAQEFAPIIRPEDLVNLSAFQFYIRLRINGSTSAPFSAETISLRKPSRQDVFMMLPQFFTGREDDKPPTAYSSEDRPVNALF